MKKNSKQKLIIALVFLILFTIPVSAFAYSRLGTGKISGGADGILYYIDDSASEYSDSIRYGIQYWNGHISTVEVNRTTTKSYSRCDNYWGNYFSNNSTIIAETQLMLNNQIIYNYNVDWYWSKILYNKNVFKYEDENGGGLSYFNRKGTACHEYGHFLGLAHTNSIPSNIMCQLGYGRTAGQPSADDISGITAIYGS